MEGIPDHPMSVVLHGAAFTVVSAVSASSNSYPKPKAEGRTRTPAARAKANGKREGESEIATGVSEARSHQRRGKKTPTFVTLQENKGRKTRSTNSALFMSIRRSGLSNVVKRSVPR